MKKITTIGLSILFLLVLKITTANADSLKYQQEKAALQYKLDSLQAQITNNPDISVSVIDGRISQLQDQWEVETNYTKGMLAKKGALSTNGSSAAILAKIDSRYQSQIDNLKQQKSIYQSQQAATARQITSLQNQIDEIDRQADLEEQQLQADTDRKNQAIADQLAQDLADSRARAAQQIAAVRQAAAVKPAARTTNQATIVQKTASAETLSGTASVAVLAEPDPILSLMQPQASNAAVTATVAPKRSLMQKIGAFFRGIFGR